MFIDLGPGLVLILLFVAAVGWWVREQILARARRRRLFKLGFTAEDLRSREQLFKRWGEILVEKLPQKISLTEMASHSWSIGAKYSETAATLESLGFRRASIFVASPQGWVVEFWLTKRPQLFAKIIDSSQRGVYTEMTVIDSEGSVVSIENTDPCGFKHREPDTWVHAGLISPAELLAKVLQIRTLENGQILDLAGCVRLYENSVNEYLVWRRSVGISADEVNNTLKLLKKKRPEI